MRCATAGRAPILAAAGVLLVFAIAEPAEQTAAVPPNQVTINKFSCAPTTLMIVTGAQVVWINHDEDVHTVASGDGGHLFKSPALYTDDKFTFTFNKPGTYIYFCSIHPHMVGTIVVK